MSTDKNKNSQIEINLASAPCGAVCLTSSGMTFKLRNPTFERSKWKKKTCYHREPNSAAVILAARRRLQATRDSPRLPLTHCRDSSVPLEGAKSLLTRQLASRVIHNYNMREGFSFEMGQLLGTI